MNWKYEFNKLIENLAFKIAWILPKWLVYYASIRLVTNATTGKHSSTITPDITACESLKRWEI